MVSKVLLAVLSTVAILAHGVNGAAVPRMALAQGMSPFGVAKRP